MGDTYLVVDGTVYDLVERPAEPLDRKTSVSQTREPVNGEEREYVDSIRESEEPAFCPMHHVAMKQRLKRDGGSWYDHREQQNGVWKKCTGKGFR